MKFKSWMEMHIVRPKNKKTKKERGVGKDNNRTPTKKSSDLTVTLPQRPQLDSAGNSPTSPQLPKRQPILVPEAIDSSSSSDVMSPTHYYHLAGSGHQFIVGADSISNANYAYYSPFRVPVRGTCACTCFNAGVPALSCTCYPAFEESCSLAEEFRRLHSIRTSFIPVDQLHDARTNANLNSPRQRSRIRTNPWLTPSNAKDLARALRTSSSGSECGSASDESSLPEGGGGGGGNHHLLLLRRREEGSSGSQSSARHSFMSVTSSTDPEGEMTPSDASVTSHSTCSVPECITTSDDDAVAVIKPALVIKPKKANDISCSDSDECETLNELGHFEENYDEYERETDILDDDTDGEESARPLYESGRTPTPTPQTYIDKIEFADGEDEAYVSPVPEADELLGPFTDQDLLTDDQDELTTPTTDSACPSDGSSDLLSPSSSFRSQLTSPTSEDGRVGGPAAQTTVVTGESRTLGQIRESLEEKVRRLRLERLLVEDKVREAREEERLRREEKIKFQKQLILHGRQILLRTLQNLREKLEDQSLRLQDAYSATLEMQLEVRRQLKAKPNHLSKGDDLALIQPSQRNASAVREAPF